MNFFGKSADPGPATAICRCGVVMIGSDREQMNLALADHQRTCDRHEFTGWSVYIPTKRFGKKI